MDIDSFTIGFALGVVAALVLLGSGASRLRRHWARWLELALARSTPVPPHARPVVVQAGGLRGVGFAWAEESRWRIEWLPRGAAQPRAIDRSASRTSIRWPAPGTGWRGQAAPLAIEIEAADANESADDELDVDARADARADAQADARADAQADARADARADADGAQVLHLRVEPRVARALGRCGSTRRLAEELREAAGGFVVRRVSSG